jgi:hypothetical protein
VLLVSTPTVNAVPVDRLKAFPGARTLAPGSFCGQLRVSGPRHEYCSLYLQFLGAIATRASAPRSSDPLPMSIGSPEDRYHLLFTHAVGGFDWASDSDPEGDPRDFFALQFTSGKLPSDHLAAGLELGATFAPTARAFEALYLPLVRATAT